MIELQSGGSHGSSTNTGSTGPGYTNSSNYTQKVINSVAVVTLLNSQPLPTVPTGQAVQYRVKVTKNGQPVPHTKVRLYENGILYNTELTSAMTDSSGVATINWTYTTTGTKTIHFAAPGVT